MVHAKTFVPKPNPVIEVVGESEFVIVPEPEIKVHAPVPTTGEFAAIIVLGLLTHNVCEVPAFATVGAWFTVIVTFEVEGEQGGFEMVHANTFVPNPNPVIDVVGEREFVMLPDPEIKVQTPVPTVAVLPFMVVVGEEIQSV